jgi:hypothetical protein
MDAAPPFQKNCSIAKSVVITITGARDHSHIVITDTRRKLCNDGGCVLRDCCLPAVRNYEKMSASQFPGELV